MLQNQVGFSVTYFYISVINIEDRAFLNEIQAKMWLIRAFFLCNPANPLRNRACSRFKLDFQVTYFYIFLINIEVRAFLNENQAKMWLIRAFFI
ncbi:MAG TPA: hypothetical protein VLK78_06505, partial [Candidatus Angelobacter sp.]|nr:hypothetical protein [Candidatus Angelobacter sp.]